MKKAILREDPILYPRINKVHDLADLVEQHGFELTVGRGRNGNVIELGESLTEGDYKSTHLETVSRRHATLIYDPRRDSFYIKDDGSGNGTRVNGKLLIASREIRRLNDGDDILFGKYPMIYEEPEELKVA